MNGIDSNMGHLHAVQPQYTATKHRVCTEYTKCGMNDGETNMEEGETVQLDWIVYIMNMTA